MTTQIPSEFVGFVRQTGVRAFDRLAARAKDLEPPLRSFVRSWGRLSDADKNALFDELIATVRTPEGREPAPAGAPPKRVVKRYDPDEVAATLPKKPMIRKRATKKGKSTKKK